MKYPLIEYHITHWKHHGNLDNIVDLQVGFCISQTKGQLYCIMNYPHQTFKDSAIINNKTFTTIIMQLNNKNNQNKYCWEEIGREDESYFKIQYITNSLYCLNDKIYIFAVRHYKSKTKSQLITRIYNLKNKIFEIFCHHSLIDVNNTIKAIDDIKHTIIDNRWILIAFRQCFYKQYNPYIKRVLELIDLKETKFGNRSQKLSLALPNKFMYLKYIYVTINNNPSLYLKIVEQFTRKIESKMSLSSYNIQQIPIILIQIINQYYYGSMFQIWFFGISISNPYFKYVHCAKFKRDIIIYDYDDLW